MNNSKLLKQPSNYSQSMPKGFTLVELIIVIVILGIITAVIGPLIGNKFGAVAQSTERARWVQQAEYAMFHIRQDLANSVPNSLCTTEATCDVLGTIVEFLGLYDLNSDYAARYRDKPKNGFDRLQPKNNKCKNKDFDGNGSDDYESCFDLLGNFTKLPMYISVNLQAPAEIRTATAPEATTEIYDSITGFTNPPTNTIPYTRVAISDAHSFSGHSPYFRAYFFDGPIAYECDIAGNTLYRVSHYNDLRSTVAFSTRVASTDKDRVIRDLVSCEFQLTAGTTYSPPSLQVKLEIGNTTESIQLVDTILLSNGS